MGSGTFEPSSVLEVPKREVSRSGFYNPSNTCWVDSTFNILRHVNEIHNDCDPDTVFHRGIPVTRQALDAYFEEKPTTTLAAAIKLMNYQDDNIKVLTNISKSNLLHNWFGTPSQEDGNTLLQNILLRLSQDGLLSTIDHFETMISGSDCPECAYRVNKYTQPYLSLHCTSNRRITSLMEEA